MLPLPEKAAALLYPVTVITYCYSIVPKSNFQDNWSQWNVTATQQQNYF